MVNNNVTASFTYLAIDGVVSSSESAYGFVFRLRPNLATISIKAIDRLTVLPIKFRLNGLHELLKLTAT